MLDSGGGGTVRRVVTGSVGRKRASYLSSDLWSDRSGRVPKRCARKEPRIFPSLTRRHRLWSQKLEVQEHDSGPPRNSRQTPFSSSSQRPPTMISKVDLFRKSLVKPSGTGLPMDLTCVYECVYTSYVWKTVNGKSTLLTTFRGT